jgi:hypothetical protein
MEFIKEGSTLPIPFNLITAPLGIVGLIKNVINWIKKEEDDEELNDDINMKTGV